MKVFLKHSIANFFYCLDLDTQQVESCSTVAGRERIERYEGVSGPLQTGNVLIASQEYYDARNYTLQRLGAVDMTPQTEEPVSGPPIDQASRTQTKPNFPYRPSDN